MEKKPAETPQEKNPAETPQEQKPAAEMERLPSVELPTLAGQQKSPPASKNLGSRIKAKSPATAAKTAAPKTAVAKAKQRGAKS